MSAIFQRGLGWSRLFTELAVKILFDDSSGFEGMDNYFAREAEIMDIDYDLDKD